MKKGRNAVAKALVMFVQITITLLAPMLICGCLGLWLNGKFHTKLWFVILLFVGMAAGFRNFYHITRQFYAKDLKQEQEALDYINQLKKEGQQHRDEDE